MKIDNFVIYDGKDLGYTLDAEQTAFRVWAPMAENVWVNLYQSGDAEAEDRFGQIPMEKGESGVWTGIVATRLKNVYYTYTIQEKGEIRETQDVYSKACGVNGQRSMAVDLRETDPDGWQEDAFAYDAAVLPVIYELHIKDFSSDAHSGIPEAYRGKYKAFTVEDSTLDGKGEKPTCLAYLKELGITHVHLLPCFDFGSVDEANPSKEQFNWGYDPVNYNVPEGSYATDAHDGRVRIREFKEMVLAFHRAGIGVIMDVVYNHTYSLDSCFQRTVPDYYYRQYADGTYSNGSICGNDTASEREMFRRYMIDSVCYWAREYHIDGFRFDLMGLHDVQTMNAIRRSLNELPNGKNILMYGEPWAGTDTAMAEDAVPALKKNVELLDEGIAIFNDDTRDAIKGSVMEAKEAGFVNGVKGLEENIASAVLAWCDGKGGYHPKNPGQTISYVSAHDNWTLWDKLQYTLKEKPDFAAKDAQVLQANKFAAGIVLTCLGTVFFQAGEEAGRTKLGNGNSYNAPASLNALDWERMYQFEELIAYYKGMLTLRRQFSGYWSRDSKVTEKIRFYQTEPGCVAFSMDAWKTSDRWKRLWVVYSARDQACTVTLPKAERMLLADGKCALPKPKRLDAEEAVTVEPQGVTVFGEPWEHSFLLTNGLGGYCSMDLDGANTRNDHALLMGSEKAPNCRYHYLTNVQELLETGTGMYDFASQFYLDKEKDQSNAPYLRRFSYDDLPEWVFEAEGITVRKQIVMVHEENTVGIRYRIHAPEKASAVLRVCPLLKFARKDQHPGEAQKFFADESTIRSDGKCLYYRTNGTFRRMPEQRITDLYFPYDARDGRDAVGTVVKNHEIRFEIRGGDLECELVYSDRPGRTGVLKLICEEKKRLKELDAAADFRSPAARRLARSADQFLVKRDSTGGDSIMAGYPFFCDWGRDTMIAVFGCAIAAGQPGRAKSVLETFARYCRKGLMPNLFPEGETEPLYNTVDASLWFIEAVYEYWKYTGDLPFVRDMLPVMEDIVRWYRKGTDFHIFMDADGLISAGKGLEQVTWMDVRYEDILPTPRHGKPVEVNALWYNALRILEEFLGDAGAEYGALAEKVKKSFLDKFWMEDKGYFKDVLSVEMSQAGAETQLRCNQVWALSLPFVMPKKRQALRALEVLEKELYTPYGMRTLSPGDAQFRSVCCGPQKERDLAYHQGTVWVFPLGAYLRAALRWMEPEKSLAFVKEKLRRFEESLWEGCVGQAAEIYDGAWPEESRGCYAQAWSVGEMLRVYRELERREQVDEYRESERDSASDQQFAVKVRDWVFFEECV
ncbi:MAG: type I pullulanase [Eubacteriales bacterium]|nr:type I pullulanase [Eubacteriales bacterium]